MRSSKVFTAAGLAALAVLGLSVLQDAPKLTGKRGEVHKYKLVSSFTNAEGTAKLKGDIARKILSVDADGGILLQESRTNLIFEYPEGNPVSAPNAVMTRMLRPDGTTAELRGEGASPEAYRAATLSTIKLPEFPLAVDKTWTWDVAADSKHGVVTAKAEYKVVGEEKLHDVDSWKIAYTVAETTGTSPASSSSTAWISKVDASLVKSDNNVKNLPIAQVGPMSGTQSLDLVP